MKICSRCEKEKREEEFSKKGDGRQAYCLECQRSYFKAYYRGEGRDKCLKRAKRHRDNNRSEMTAFLNGLKNGPCTDCGNKFNPWQMDFDHVKGRKRRNVATMRLYSREAILKEVAKCELVCSNCHRNRTYERNHSLVG